MADHRTARGPARHLRLHQLRTPTHTHGHRGTDSWTEILSIVTQVVRHRAGKQSLCASNETAPDLRGRVSGPSEYEALPHRPRTFAEIRHGCHSLGHSQWSDYGSGRMPVLMRGVRHSAHMDALPRRLDPSLVRLSAPTPGAHQSRFPALVLIPARGWWWRRRSGAAPRSRPSDRCRTVQRWRPRTSPNHSGHRPARG